MKIHLGVLAFGLLLIGAGCKTNVVMNEPPTPQSETATSATLIAASSTAETPRIEVKNRALAADKFVIQEVVATEDGWLVIHQVVDGKPGPVIGKAPITAGSNNNILVPVDKTKVTEKVIAMLHVDKGTKGTFDPTEDVPVVGVDSNTVVAIFTVTNFSDFTSDKKDEESKKKEPPKEAVEVNTKVETEIETGVVVPRTEAFYIEARQWKFVPDTIKVRKGSFVQLVFESKDVDHGVAIPDFNIKAALAPGQRTKVEFVPDKVGTFSFSCNVFCGDGHGAMRGTLVVEE